MHERETLKLEELLKSVAKPQMANDRKAFLKQRVFDRLEAPVGEFVIGLDPLTRARIKERVFSLIEAIPQKSFFWRNLFAFHKKLVAGAMMFLMVFGLFNFMNVETTVVFADTFTTLESFSGTVYLKRDGKYFRVKNTIPVFEKDMFITGEDGTATIKFFDDSVSRLAPETSVVVNKLFRPKESTVSSYVELSVTKGNVWSYVVSLVEKKSAFVVESMGVYTSARKGSFNVEVVDGGVEVEVFKNAVEVANGEEVSGVVSGKKFFVGTDSSGTRLAEIAESEEELEWVQENLRNDMEYLEVVEQSRLAAKAESIGVDVDDPNSNFGASWRERTSLLLTFDDVKKKKKELNLAERSFVAAQIKLQNKELSEDFRVEAERAVDDFATKVQDFYGVVEEVRVADSAYADELEKYVDEKVLVQKKGLSLTLPDSPAYKAKEIVGDLELLTADEDEDIIDIKRDHASERLSDAQEVSLRGDKELASKVIGNYKQDIEEVVDILESNGEIKEDKKAQFVEGVTGDIELLDTMDKGAGSEVRQMVGVREEVPPALEPVNPTSVVRIPVKEDVNFGIKIDGDKPLPPLLSE